MENSEKQWLQEKAGYFSASSLGLLMASKKGGWIQTSISYIFKVERQRTTGEPAPPISSKQMSIGTEQEPYAFAWLKENYREDLELLSKVFKKVDWAMYGASLDVISSDGWDITEIKTVTGDTEINWYFSPSVPFESKRLKAFDAHRHQMAGQLLAYPEAQTINLFKYDPQLDGNEFDLRSPLDKSRGLLFSFTLEEFGSLLDEAKTKIIQADNYLKLGLNPEDIANYYKGK